MKAKFIEDADLKLALSFEPETDDESLLLRSFAAQCEPNNLLRIRGFGMGGETPGLRHVRVFQERPSQPEPTVDQLRAALREALDGWERAYLDHETDEDHRHIAELRKLLEPTKEPT
jgi:hypothetical protein